MGDKDIGDGLVEEKVVCEPWEKGEDCGWNQRTARLTLLPFLLAIFGTSMVIIWKLLGRNSSWRARPVLCMILVTISQGCDIVEHILVLTEMKQGGNDWYANSTIDALGDIFLMASLYLFAVIWCDNIRVVTSGSDELHPTTTRKLALIKRMYFYLAIFTVPFALLFSLGSVTHHYDEFMIIYVAWGAVSGFFVLTPAAILMYKAVKAVESCVQDGALYKQLTFMARVNFYEQVLWNVLMLITIGTIVGFLHGHGKSSALIGTASVSISICWILIHLQVVLFFIHVTRAGDANSPVFSDHMLASLLEDGFDEEYACASSSNANNVSLREKIELADINTSRVDPRKVVSIPSSARQEQEEEEGEGDSHSSKIMTTI